jgi:hypothetical protein
MKKKENAMANDIPKIQGAPAPYQITTSQHDKNTMTAHGIDVKNIVDELQLEIFALYGAVQAAPLAIGASHVARNDLSGKFSSITAINHTQETCPICQTTVKVRYMFSFTGTKEYFETEKKKIDLNPLDAHRILRHEDFGVGARHTDPVLLSEFLKDKVLRFSIPVDAFIEALEKALESKKAESETAK